MTNPKTVDLSTWTRRSHFHHFRDYAMPIFEVCARVDVTGLVERARRDQESLFGALLFEVMSAVNEVPQLRQRIRGDEVVEHDTVHPSYTVLVDDEHFNFCYTDFCPDRGAFLADVTRAAKGQRGRLDLALEEDARDDLVYVTSLPWLDFTSVTHALAGDWSDGIPRVAWGKVVRGDAGASVSVQLSAHHALADGLHAARFFELLESRTGRGKNDGK